MQPNKQWPSSIPKQRKMENPLGAGKKQAPRVTSDSRLKLECHGVKVTSDADLTRPCFGITRAVTPGAHGSEVSLTVKPMPGEGIVESFYRLAVALKELDTTIVHLTVFGSIGAHAAGMEAMRRQFGNLDWPVTWIEGVACDDSPIAGLQVFGFAGGEVNRIKLNGRVVGSVFNDGAARHCL